MSIARKYDTLIKMRKTAGFPAGSPRFGAYSCSASLTMAKYADDVAR